MNLTNFCLEYDTPRFELSKPCVRDAWRYAANGIVIIRLPAHGEPDTDLRFPVNAPEMFAGFPDCETPLSLEMLKKSTEDCPHCDGEGHEPVKCKTCHGTGSCTCTKCNDDHDCGDCDGTGEVPGKEPCTECKGSRKVSCIANSMLSGSLYNGEKLRLILTELTGVRYSSQHVLGNALCFTADGGVQGILMAMSEANPHNATQTNGKPFLGDKS